MANNYTAHKDEWKVLADIDYYGMFVKTYIPFNAWMNVSYHVLNTDRAKINEIKHNTNPFRNKICSLLESPSQDGQVFRNAIGDLHYLLENHYIYNQEKRITLTCVVTGKNNKNLVDVSKYGIRFRVQYGDSRTSNTETRSIIKRRDESLIINLIQKDYNLDELKKMSDFISIRKDDHKNFLINCYEQVNPYVVEDFTKGFDPGKAAQYYVCGSFTFKRDKDGLAAALIEIIYNMRNSLFHGEIVPDKDANKTYGAAYKILRILIEAI